MATEPTDEDRKRAREWEDSKSSLALLIAEVRRETAEEIAKEIEATIDTRVDTALEVLCIKECAAIARKHAKRGKS